MVKLDPPQGLELPVHGFAVEDNGYQEPAKDGSEIKIEVDKDSDRLQLLEPFAPWIGKDLRGLKLFIKAQGKCTTDHISMAGPWLKYRGHLENISKNLMLGAVNEFNGKTNQVKNQENGKYMPVYESVKHYKDKGLSSIIIGDENYGEGSSREHAAMEPRFMGVKAVIVKSFARIHETNLKKQGVLGLTFANPDDYDKIQEDDNFDILGLETFAPESIIKLVANHSNGSKDEIELKHSYNEVQISWFKAGSALNKIRESNS